MLRDLILPIAEDQASKRGDVSLIYKAVKSESISTPEDISLWFYGVLGLRIAERKNNMSYLCVKDKAIHDFYGIKHKKIPSEKDMVRIYVDDSTDNSVLVQLLKDIIMYCSDNCATTFDVCSHYKECSAAMDCVINDRDYHVECSYRKKLTHGIQFYCQQQK